jgi:hypothetical protein
MFVPQEIQIAPFVGAQVLQLEEQVPQDEFELPSGLT